MTICLKFNWDGFSKDEDDFNEWILSEIYVQVGASVYKPDSEIISASLSEWEYPNTIGHSSTVNKLSILLETLWRGSYKISLRKNAYESGRTVQIFWVWLICD